MNGRVAVITGFYKNTDFLQTLFESLNNQTFTHFDVYVYNSSGIPLADVGSNYSFTYKIINLKDNAGFAGGNNQAIQAARESGEYKYYALINDDTKPQPGWLEALVTTAEQDPAIGAVSSKMVFYERFVTIRGLTQAINVNDRKLGLRWYHNSSFNECFYPKKFYKEGFYNEETDEINAFRWTSEDISIEMPVSLRSGLDEYTLRLFLRKHSKLKDQYLDLYIGDTFLTNIDLHKENLFYEVKVPASLINEHAHYIIQNAGSGYDKGYNGFDIGSGELDLSQYDKEKDIQLFCGGACLLSAKALEKTGLFNGYFFSYYEDSDLSMRIRKKNFRIVYAPRSLVLHYHTGTSKEWSLFFIYHVFRNKIIFTARNFGMFSFIRAFAERSKETVRFLKWNVKARFKDPILKSRLKLNLRILWDSIKGIIKYKPARFQ